MRLLDKWTMQPSKSRSSNCTHEFQALSDQLWVHLCCEHIIMGISREGIGWIVRSDYWVKWKLLWLGFFGVHLFNCSDGLLPPPPPSPPSPSLSLPRCLYSLIFLYISSDMATLNATESRDDLAQAREKNAQTAAGGESKRFTRQLEYCHSSQSSEFNTVHEVWVWVQGRNSMMHVLVYEA